MMLIRLAKQPLPTTEQMESKMNANDGRIEIEKRIAKRVITDALAAGYSLSVNDGEDTTLHSSRDMDAILAAMRSTDEDRLLFHIDHREHAPAIGWVRFIYGNDGPDVINDYTTNLEAVLAGANALADRLDGQTDFDPENIYGLASMRQSVEEDRAGEAHRGSD